MHALSVESVFGVALVIDGECSNAAREVDGWSGGSGESDGE